MTRRLRLIKFKRLLSAIALGLGLGPPLLLADGGMVVPQGMTVTETDQAAIIRHSVGREQIGLAARFTTNASELAWLVPLPSLPTVDSFPTSFLWELQEYTAPIYRSSQGLACGCGGTYDPMLERGRAYRDSTQVREISGGIIGDFSYQVLQAFLADTLENYLTGHGYSLPSGTRDVFGYYLQKGWNYFFVARLADTALRYNYHNLGVSLEFASDSIVFPLYVSRMSSSESYVSLYVLAEHRQMFRGGRLRFSGKVKPGTFRYGGTFIDRPYHLTKLTKHFPRNEMQDICLQQAPDDQDYQEVVYSSPYWVMPLGLLCIPGLLLGWRQGSRRMFGASSKVQRLHHPS